MATDSRDQEKPELPEVYQQLIKTMLLPHNVSQKGIDTVLCWGRTIYESGLLEGQTDAMRESNKRRTDDIRSQADQIRAVTE